MLSLCCAIGSCQLLLSSAASFSGSLNYRRSPLTFRNRLLNLTLLWFAFGLALVLMAGRGYGHYFMSLAPALGIAAGLFFWLLEEQELPNNLAALCGALIAAPILMAYMPGVITATRDLKAAVRHHPQRLPVDDAVAELKRIAPPSSTLLVWGFEPSFFSATQMRPASRYVTSHYIYDSPRSYVEVGSVLLNEIRLTPPDFVVVAPCDNCQMKWSDRPDGIRSEFMAEVQNSYSPVWGKDSFTIYRHVAKDEQTLRSQLPNQSRN